MNCSKNRLSHLKLLFIRIALISVFYPWGGMIVDAQCTPTQVFKLLPNDGGEGHQFGRSVHIDGTMAIIGSYDGDMALGDGAAYLFDTSTGQQLRKWAQQKVILAVLHGSKVIGRLFLGKTMNQ